MSDFTHFDEEGRAVMVDVGGKPATTRTATARGAVVMAPETLEMIGPNRKIDAVAEAAGTIGYEILTSLGARYNRSYLGGV